MISDSDECIVIEQMKDGLKIYENPYGVLTNNPPFHYQLINITNYRNLTPNYVDSRFSNKVNLGQYGQWKSDLSIYDLIENQQIKYQN